MISDNTDNIEKAKKLAAGPLGSQMAKFPMRFSAAVCFGEKPARDRHTKVNNGTIALIDLGAGPMGITCAHVIAGYRKIRDEFEKVIFQIGNVVIDPLSQLIAEDSSLDLASIRLTEDQVKKIPFDGEIGSCVFKPVSWPPSPLREGDSIAFGGFPGSFRERPVNDEIVFGSWSSGSSLVTTISEDRFSCLFEREYWVSAYGDKHHMSLKDLGGMSGGPAFVHRGLKWEWVGLIYEFSQDYDIMFFRPASLINLDGSINSTRT